jgi:hypothetical protein
MKDSRVYLIHIRDCISRIKQYTVEGKEVFLVLPIPLCYGIKIKGLYGNLKILKPNPHKEHSL